MTIRNRIASLLKPTAKNNAGVGLGNRFLRYGNSKPLVQDWSQLLMSDQDLYSGYVYAAIRKRANRVAQLATENIVTEASKAVMDAAKIAKAEIKHPYLTKIDTSLTFSNYRFWYEVSIYLDIKAVYYLMAVRNVSGNRVGNVTEFQLLNPYEIQRVFSKDSLEVKGYVQNKGGFTRAIPKEMIIPIADLNPFSDTETYSMTDAAKPAVFTKMQAGDYTRHTLKGNINSPGIISSDVILEDEQFENFIARLRGAEKGVPLFGNGSGALKWDSMQIDLDKAALDKITAMSIEETMAVTGVSKTIMGIEQSGTTRETSRVQNDLFITGEITPRLQLILDALDLDYKRYYAADYAKNEYRMCIDSPLGTDREAELSDINIRTKSYELYTTLISKGYDSEIAGKYAQGEIPLEELGEPKNAPAAPETPPTQPTPPTPPADMPMDAPKNHLEHLPVVHNQLETAAQATLKSQEASLKNTVTNIEERIVVAAITKVTHNAYESQSDIIAAQDRKDLEHELEAAIALFYGVVIPLYAMSTIKSRITELGMFGQFKLDKNVKTYINAAAARAAKSHMDTILEDLLTAVQAASLEGASQQELVSAIRREYVNITGTRATAIARTETNRAFTAAQFEADRQFLAQNDLTGKAYKKLINRSDNPCAFCREMASRAPIPFDQNFADLGDVLTTIYERADGTTSVRKLPVNYEAITAGNLHVNCSCGYLLVIM